MQIPFGTVEINKTAKKLIYDCLERGRISSGELVRKFEKQFADLIGVNEAVAVSSGTDADILALAALNDFGANREDEVILPALSFVATGNAVIHAGFKPVFVDIRSDSFNIDPEKIEAAITERTKAIMPVHLMGQPAPMDDINKIAEKYNLSVIEDAAEAHGAEYKGCQVGSLGRAAAFSLYVAHIITTGEGGIITTNDESYAEVLRSLRAHGRACKCKKCISNINSGFCEKRFAQKDKGDIRFVFERIGYSCKMNELEAAIGIGALESYAEILDKRHSNLMTMVREFMQFSDFFWTFQEATYEKIGPHAFPFVLKKDLPFSRDELMLHLEKSGVDARTLFSSMPTQCGGYEYLGYSLGEFPQAEYIGENGIHIGVHQHVHQENIDAFIKSIQFFLKEHT